MIPIISPKIIDPKNMNKKFKNMDITCSPEKSCPVKTAKEWLSAIDTASFIILSPNTRK